MLVITSAVAEHVRARFDGTLTIPTGELSRLSYDVQERVDWRSEIVDVLLEPHDEILGL
jgi:hypothetical protein